MSPAAEPVAIIGAGAIGMAFGAALARAGHPITVCGGTPVDFLEITEDGETGRIQVVHSTHPGDIAGHRLVILAVKAQQTPATADWIRACDHPDTALVVAQNGIEQHERVAPYRQASQVVPAIVYVNVERPGPGRAIIRRAPVENDIVISTGPAAVRVKQCLEAGGMRVGAEPDFTTVAWLKLMTNLITNPLTALTLRRVEVLREPGIARFALRLLTEAAQVGRAEGARIADDQPERTLAWLQGFPDGATTSMLQDRLAGRSLEHDAITGAVLRAAGRHGLAVPNSESLHALVDALDADRAG